MGKISYGIYLYHLMILHFSAKALTFLNRQLPFNGASYNIYLVTAENFIILLMVSYASWKLIEQPLLQYKEKFTYKQPVKQLEAETVLVLKTEEPVKR
jgi:peptidoglycan/LPS O-acetylase OafA/YrhL